MIRLGSENFPVTYLKSNSYLNVVSYCVSRKLISLSHLRNGKFLTLFYPEIYRSKFLCDQIIKAIGLILRHNMFGVPIIFLLLQLISKYAQKSK